MKSNYTKFVNPDLGSLLESLNLDKTFVKGDGIYLEDKEGIKYMDFIGAYGALPFGHSPQEISNEINNIIVSKRPNFVQPSCLEEAGKLAKNLIDITPDNLKYVTFQNSGAEAVEAAIKACWAATGRKGIISTKRSFHGKTLGALSATGSDNFQQVFNAPVPGFEFVQYDNIDEIENLLRKNPCKYAAIILEPIQGEGGVNVPSNGYLKKVQELCKKYGVLFILDEVQTGLGRTGYLFAFEKFGVNPDCLVLAKALGGGMIPIGACILSDASYSSDFALKHSSTFAGNTIACGVGNKVLDLLLNPEKDLIRHVKETGFYLKSELEKMAAKYKNIIKEVRGEGFLLGIEFSIDRSTFDLSFGSFLGILAEQKNILPILASYLLNIHKIRVAPTLNSLNVLRIEPPLTTTKEQCDAFISGLEESLMHLSEGNTGKLLSHIVQGKTCDSKPINRRLIIPNLPKKSNHFAFIVHPLDRNSFKEFDESLCNFSDKALRKMEEKLSYNFDPFYVSSVVIESPTKQKAYGDFYMIPHSAEQLVSMDKEYVNELIGKTIDMAKQSGATIVGLGGYTSIVTLGGTTMVDRGVNITTGNTYTMLSVCEAIHNLSSQLDIDIAKLHVAIIGAVGSIGSAVVKSLLPKIQNMTLIGNPSSKDINTIRFAKTLKESILYLENLEIDSIAPNSLGEVLLKEYRAKKYNINEYTADIVNRKNESFKINFSSNYNNSIKEADIVVIATNNASKFVDPQYLKKGAIVFDLSRPANVMNQVTKLRDDILVIDGGIIEAPGKPLLGGKYGISENLCYACMAETMMLSLDGINKNFSLGFNIKDDEILTISALAKKHNFKLASYSSFDRPIPEDKINNFKKYFYD
ncbi:MAG: aminotransferase class III-fold pyridoxal phosphate-dependent enzyme [Pseudomonadota bacterium]